MEHPDRDNEISEREKGFARMRNIMHVGMGTLWTSMGVFLVFIEKFGTGLEYRFGDPVMKAFGGICILYGLFRIYRGFSKITFR